MNKISLFEYFLFKLTEWYSLSNNLGSIESFNSDNDLSKLKVLKLHFFTSASNIDLLNVFDNFHALPYGHVESYIFENLNQLERFEVTDRQTIIKSDSFEDLENSFDSVIEKKDKSLVDNGISMLEKSNPEIINYSAFTLVELSHSWLSWIDTINRARQSGSLSRRIPVDLIKNERKTYRFSV